MSAQPSIFPTARVLVSDGVVYIRELDEADQEVVRIVGEASLMGYQSDGHVRGAGRRPCG